MELWFIPCGSKDSAILKTGTKLEQSKLKQELKIWRKYYEY